MLTLMVDSFVHLLGKQILLHILKWRWVKHEVSIQLVSGQIHIGEVKSMQALTPADG